MIATVMLRHKGTNTLIDLADDCEFIVVPADMNIEDDKDMLDAFYAMPIDETSVYKIMSLINRGDL